METINETAITNQAPLPNQRDCEHSHHAVNGLKAIWMETETMTKIKDIESALKSFEAAADKQAEATEQGDYKTANKNCDIIIAAIEFLKEHNRLILLDEFLNHSSVGVRLWAASYLLNIKKDEAVKTLIAIARSGGIHSLTAGTTLSEWKKGNLKS